MKDALESLHLIEATDVLADLRQFVLLSRQQANWTQGEMARRAGVPATTISRLERTGLASTETLFRIFFALNELDGVHDWLKERMRLKRAIDEGKNADRRRVRHERIRS